MELFTTPERMQAWAVARAQQGQRIALVPTMGYFHEGHLSLMRRAGQLADVVVTSLFVNPTQFGPNEDLASYPRDRERDLSLAKTEGVDAVFAPTPESMYPSGFQSEVRVSGLTDTLCGASRPGHFNGVTTVVTKLFHIVCPNVAIFGEKDFQQLAVIRQMVRDLNVPIEIIGHPIVREADGLAMSSRNTRLAEEDRAVALSLSSGLQVARRRAADGQLDPVSLHQEICNHIESFSGTRIDYVVLADCDTLQPVTVIDERTVVLMAVYIKEKVRLIDNGFVLP